MKQKITIKTIAKELGVSTSTVSKALRDSHEISSETKDKISGNFQKCEPIAASWKSSPKLIFTNSSKSSLEFESECEYELKTRRSN